MRRQILVVVLIGLGVLLLGATAFAAKKGHHGGGGKGGGGKGGAHRGAAPQRPHSRPRSGNAARAPAAQQAEQDQQGTDGAASPAAVEADPDVISARQAVDDAVRDLAKLESDIEKAQSAASDFGEARDSYREIEEKYKAAIEAITSSEKYKAAIAEAKESDRVGVNVAAVRRQFVDSNPEIVALRSQLKSAKSKYESARAALLKNDPKWVAAVEDLQKKREALATAISQATSSLLAGNGGKSDDGEEEPAAPAPKDKKGLAQAEKKQPQQELQPQPDLQPQSQPLPELPDVPPQLDLPPVKE